MRHRDITQWRLSNLSTSTGITSLVIVALAPAVAWALATENWLVLAGLGSIAVLPIVATWPVASTLGLYALCTSSLDVFPLLPGGATITKLVGVVAAGALLAAGLMERRLTTPPRAALWWAAFMVWAMLSAAWALDITLAVQWLPKALSFVVLYLVTVSFKPTPREVFWVCVLTVIGGALAGVLTYTIGFDAGAQIKAARAKLTLGDMVSNPNALGRMLLLPLSLAIAGFVDLRGALKRGLAAGCIALITIGIYLCMSRAAIVAMFVMLSVFVYRLRASRYAVAAMVLLLALTLAMPDAFYQRIGSVASGDDPTGSGRTEIWAITWHSLPNFAFVGAGLNNFARVYEGYIGSAAFSGGAHNIYLMVAVELGLVGLVLMLAALFEHFLAARRARIAGRDGTILTAAEAACFGIVTTAFFGDTLWTKPFWLAWMILIWSINSGGSDRSSVRSIT